MGNSATKAGSRQASFVQRWRSAVLSKGSGLTSSQRLSLVALAQFADADGGSCFPSSVTIAAASALSDKTVRTCFDTAAAAGWLIRSKREGVPRDGKDWRGYSYEYRLQIPDGAEAITGASGDGAVTASGPTVCMVRKIEAHGAETDADGAEAITGDVALDLALTRERSKAKAKEGASRHSSGDDLFSTGLQYLISTGIEEKKARPFLGLLRKQVGNEEACRLIGEAERQKVSEPIAWLSAATKHTLQRAPAAVNASFADKTYVSDEEKIRDLLGN